MDDATESDVLYEAISILMRVSARSFQDIRDDLGRVEMGGVQRKGGRDSDLFFTLVVGLLVLGFAALVARNEHVQRWVLCLSNLVWRCARKLQVAVTRLVLVISRPVRKPNMHLNLHNSGSTWDLISESRRAACYALQGRRPKMEDRFTLVEKLAATPLHLFAVYDGHGGEFAADYVQRWILNWLEKRAVKYKNVPLHSGVQEMATSSRKGSCDECAVPVRDKSSSADDPAPSSEQQQPATSNSRKSRPISNGSINSLQQQQEQDVAMSPTLRRKPPTPLEDRQMDSGRSMMRTVSRQSSGGSLRSVAASTPKERKRFSAFANEFDMSQELNTAILESDKALIQAAKKANDVAGSTALVALLDTARNQLTVANVGDSRGILCDIKGTVIPLSFDHKPQQLKERKRIQEAGGFISFNGVWRVAGILATSRALGDFPLKDRKLLIAEPDVLSFDLQDLRLQKPSFLILASDGLWDAFSNEEAAFYVRTRLHEPHMGAKSLAMAAHQRGSVDNITVLIVNLSNL